MTAPTNDKPQRAFPALQWATLAICIAILAVALWAQQGRGPRDARERIDERISMASAMLNEGLPAEAIAEYTAALDLAGGDAARKANLCYLIGKTYFETVKDYEKALAYFARAKHYNPNHPESSQMSKWSVECLERLGRSLDAHNRVARATALRPGNSPASSPLVARIGDRNVTVADLDAEIRLLPPDEQKRYTDPKEKAEYLEQSIARQVLAAAAVRSGIPNDPQVLSTLDRMREALLAEAYLNHEMAGVVTSPDEAKLYYDAHKEEFRGPRTFQLSHIQLAGEKATSAAVEMLEKGTPFSAVAEKQSANAETRKKGGRLGEWVEDQPLPAPLAGAPSLRSVIAGLKAGERTAPVKTESGAWQIVHVDNVTSGTPRPFETVQQSVAARVAWDKRAKKQNEIISRLRQAEKVVVYPEAMEKR